jgi:hypothetical protein
MMTWLTEAIGAQATTAVVGALVGGLIGLAGSLFTQLFVQWRQRVRFRRNLLVALEAEVTVLMSVLTQAWELRDRASEGRIVGSYWIVPWTTLHTTHVGVYGKAATDLGLLPTRLVSRIVSFYGQVAALQEFVKSAEPNPQRTWSQEFSGVLTQEIGRRYHQVWVEGDELLKQFRADGSWRRIPSWLKRKPLAQEKTEGEVQR